MIIDSILPSPLTHLACTHTERVEMGPPPFRILQVRLSRPSQKIKIEIELALLAVVMKVQFRKNDLRSTKDLLLEAHVGR
jgi:hypothetical protein